MNKAANKKIIAIVAVLALVAILGICLVACTSNSVGDKLDKKGYSVAKLNEDSTGTAKLVYDVAKSDEGFKEGVFASKKSGDFVAVVWYNSEQNAKDAENGFKYIPGATVERLGKIVYVGTEQGIKDAK